MSKTWFSSIPGFSKSPSSIEDNAVQRSRSSTIHDEESELISDVNLTQRDRHQTVNSIIEAKKNPSTVFKPPFGTKAEEHHTKLGEHAQHLWKQNMMTDLVVNLEGKQYPCHKTVLSCYSKYFKELILEQKGVVNIINLRLPSVSKAAFEVLLTYMYTADLNLTCQNIGEVYTAAIKLGMDDALLLCTNVLSGKSKHDVYPVYVYVTAKKQQLEDCAAKAMKIMTRRFEHIVGTPEFLDLDFSQVSEYLSQDVLATRSEVIVFLAAMKWLHVKFLEREEYAADLIECVRFPMMTLNEILACFSPPLLPGILELKKIKNKMLEATCFVAAALINEEKRFERYFCRPRKYLLKREPTILWDPSIFDPDRHTMYRKEIAASRIQAAFRGYKIRKNIGGRKASLYLENSDELFTSVRTSENFEVPESNNEEEQKKNGDNELQKENKNEQSKEPDEMEEESFTSQKMSDHSRSSSIDTLLGCVTDLAEKTEIKLYKSDSVVDIRPEIFQNLFNRTETIHKIYTRPSIGYDKDLTEKASISSSQEYTFSLSPEKAEGYILPGKEFSNSTSEENMGSKDNSAGYLLVTGGFRTDDVTDESDGKSLLIYNVAKKKWKNYGTMLKARHHHRLVLLNDEVYFIGGCNLEKTKSRRLTPDKKCYKLNLNSGYWSKIRKMIHSRMYHGAVEISGKIYIVGGKDSNDRLLKSVEVYNPDTNEWEELDESLETPTMGSGACVHQGKIWVIGGMIQEKDGTLRLLSTVQCYNPNKKRWSKKIRELPSPRAFPTVASLDSEIYVIGGISEDEKSQEKQMTSIADVLFYSKKEKRWILAATLPSPRHLVNANAIGSCLYILGGFTSYARTTIDEIVVYEKKTGKWHHGAPLPKPLYGFASISISDILHK